MAGQRAPMVKRQRFIDQFMDNFAESGEIIFDVRDKSSISLAVLKEKIEAVSRFFRIIRHSKEDKAVLFLDNSIDFVVILLALIDENIVIVPLNPGLNEEKVRYLAGHAQAKFLITSPAIMGRHGWVKELGCRVISTQEVFQPPAAAGKAVRVACHEPSRAKDLKLLLYTSGTVGSPKGVMVSKQALRLKVLGLIALLKFKKGSTFFSFLPFFSGHGMIPGMLVPLLSGCKIYIAAFDPFLSFGFWDLVKEYRINSFTSVPSVLALLKERIGDTTRVDLKCVRAVYCASSPLPQVMYDWYADHLGLHVRNCYGLTEAISWVSVNMNPGRRTKACCVGRPFIGDIAAFDGEGRRLDHHETGELGVRSACLMAGYFKDMKATRGCLRKDGYMKTGDVGFIDAKGSVHILDRIKHLIIKNGINVHPSEVDQVFLGHPDVKDALTFGVLDEHYGEKIVTALILKEAFRSREKYFSYAAQKLAKFLVPHDIFFLEEFQRGATGKALVESIRYRYLTKGKENVVRDS